MTVRDIFLLQAYTHGLFQLGHRNLVDDKDLNFLGLGISQAALVLKKPFAALYEPQPVPLLFDFHLLFHHFSVTGRGCHFLFAVP